MVVYRPLRILHAYDNDDQILQDLLETNIRQRGDVGGSAKKVGRRIKELERLYGIVHGNNQYSSIPNNSVSSQSDIASQMNISVDTLQNYKLLADMIPELSDLFLIRHINTPLKIHIIDV